MADFTNASVQSLVAAHINNRAKSRVTHTSSSSSPSWDNCNRTGFTGKSTIDEAAKDRSGDATPYSVYKVVEGEAYRSTAIRTVYWGQYFSGSWYTDGYRNTGSGRVSMTSGYRRSVARPANEYAWSGHMKPGTTMNRDNFKDYLDRCWGEVSSLINSGSLDRRVCHTSCHMNCHSSRGRR